MLKVALIQLTSGADIDANIVRVRELVEQAAKNGAEFIATPENTFLMESPHIERVRFGQDQHPGMAAASEMAKQHKVWLLVGSVAVLPDQTPHPATSAGQVRGRTYNRSVLFDPNGSVAAHYDKIHLFDVEVGDGQTYKESARMLHGEKAVVAELPSAKLGMTICYDVRFPQLYRQLAKQGAGILAVPSAFTQVTGEAHWHILLRARAIETGCFVIAPAQCGTHPGGRKTYGHSLIVNPWGEIIADGGTEEGVVMAEIDLSDVAKARGRIPSLRHDRNFSS